MIAPNLAEGSRNERHQPYFTVLYSHLGSGIVCKILLREKELAR